MSQNPGYDAAIVAKSLLRRSRQGALATLTPVTGNPYCSLVNIATAGDGSPLLLISRLALHTQNILADSRVSLMLDERRGGDPLEGARIMLSGQAFSDDTAIVAAWRRRYLAAHPEAEAFVNFTDFSFFRIAAAQIHVVAGFGRISNLLPSQVLTEVSDATDLLDAEPDIIAHLNTGHRDTLRLYVTRLLGGPDANWRCTGCDPDGLDLATDGLQNQRLSFPQRVVTPGALRHVLKQMATLARGS